MRNAYRSSMSDDNLGPQMHGAHGARGVMRPYRSSCVTMQIVDPARCKSRSSSTDEA